MAIVLTAAAACLLSFSLILQRYALAHKDPSVPFLFWRLPRNVVWFCGLVLYGGANGLKVVGFQYGPLSVLSSVFTLVLVFNLGLARLILHEWLTVPKVIGSLVIVGGAALAAVGSCQHCEIQFSARQVEGFVSADPPGGAFYLVVLVSLIIASAVTMWRRLWRC